MYENLSTVSMLAFMAAIVWLFVSIFRLIPKKSRASAKRHAIISLIAMPITIAIGIYAGNNVHLDYGLESREGLAEAREARAESEAQAQADRAAQSALGQQQREAQQAADRAERRCNDGVMAAIMSERFISQQLRAPSTAQYPSANSAQVGKIDDCIFRVTSYVDAQNAFGAMIRSRYQIDMEYLPDTDRWRGFNSTIE